jgi:NTP pyrophosphatase (non-canonical NTP hydrolase)
MTPNEYQVLTRETWNNNLTAEQRLTNAALGLAGEAGEVVELIKKELYHGKGRDLDKICKELGDVLYYAARLADEVGLPLSDVLQKNYEKLSTRYPGGFELGGGKR